MSHVDQLFVEILRFSIIGLILLLATQASLRFLNQPIERIRLIQISLFALVSALALGLAGILPAVDVALLPVAKTKAQTTSVVGTDGQPRSLTRAAGDEALSLTLEDDVLNSRDAVVSATAASNGGTIQHPMPTTISMDSTTDVGFIPSLKRFFVYGFLSISFLNAAYLAIGFVTIYRLIASSTSLSDAAAERVDRIINQFSSPGPTYFVRSARIEATRTKRRSPLASRTNWGISSGATC
jgi:hypothetical protein